VPTTSTLATPASTTQRRGPPGFTAKLERPRKRCSTTERSETSSGASTLPFSTRSCEPSLSGTLAATASGAIASIAEPSSRVRGALGAAAICAARDPSPSGARSSRTSTTPPIMKHAATASANAGERSTRPAGEMATPSRTFAIRRHSSSLRSCENAGLKSSAIGSGMRSLSSLFTAPSFR
jgi:hypothetical protein